MAKKKRKPQPQPHKKSIGAKPIPPEQAQVAVDRLKRLMTVLNAKPERIMEAFARLMVPYSVHDIEGESYIMVKFADIEKADEKTLAAGTLAEQVYGGKPQPEPIVPQPFQPKSPPKIFKQTTPEEVTPEDFCVVCRTSITKADSGLCDAHKYDEQKLSTSGQIDDPDLEDWLKGIQG